MNKIYTNNNFHGKIDGNRCVDYYRKINNKTASSKEAIENIIDVLNIEDIDGVQFVNEFWTKVFLQNDEDEFIGGIKLILNKEDSLYSESNIAKTLEKMGTLILDKSRIKDNPLTHCKVYHSLGMFNKAIDELETLRNIINNNSEAKYSMDKGLTYDIVLANQSNYKHEKKIKDLNDKDMELLNNKYKEKYPQIDDYYKAYINIRKQYNKIKRIPESELEKYPEQERSKHKFRKLTPKESEKARKLNAISKELKQDFIDCLNAKIRPIVFKCPLPDKGCPDYGLIDFFNAEHIKALLPVKRGENYQNDLDCIIHDLDELLKECNFTDKQRTLIEMLREDKTYEFMGQQIGVDRSTVNKYINLAVNKIVNKYEEQYEDWYYMNVQKGKYKKCNKCNKVKLTSKFSKKGKGLQPYCKECQRK